MTDGHQGSLDACHRLSLIMETEINYDKAKWLTHAQVHKNVFDSQET